MVSATGQPSQSACWNQNCRRRLELPCYRSPSAAAADVAAVVVDAAVVAAAVDSDSDTRCC